LQNSILPQAISKPSHVMSFRNCFGFVGFFDPRLSQAIWDSRNPPPPREADVFLQIIAIALVFLVSQRLTA
jgi:hypothetical protein